ncbi:hypothetical protein [Pseudobacteriovorax antillogorgiicola]|uniref:tRNA_anti-like n=1 Tax=Pseudobacteriovorax antillogorgiicola TaxID=1513793 RepID=A0A1Y6B2Y8_9BACT|nr:hypothetical protein [Pseudobacteriovorax antillogorgiicola]TCS59388.1 hypothetical protein EDD56_101298 [Pseudobacteriovorax antillogorgiicola]SME88723.1 hypothetical protein SAMN06296036_101187 [Pseudobacteriovorax antillogorgiicola]
MKILPLLLVLFVSSCTEVEELKKSIDHGSFSWSGGTVFSEPSLVTTKEIHFDTGNLLGREIIIEGKIESLGKYDTHLVISDESGRMLVVLTHVEDANRLLAEESYERLRVLGTVERGKKGLPYILAKALNLISQEDVK